MAVLKKIKFGTGAATPIAQTVVTAASGSVLSVVGTNTDIDDNADPSYAVDLNISADGTLVKDTTGGQAVLKVGTVPAAQVSVAAGGHTDGTQDGKAFVGEDVEEVLTELNKKIADVGGEAKSYQIVSVASPASTNLAEYKIQEKVGTGSWGEVSGSATIVVPKDQHLKSVSLEDEDDQQTAGQFLKFTYVLNDGTERDVYVDVSSFLTQSEFGDGLEVSNAGVVSVKLGNGVEFGNEATGNKSLNVKIDSTSEPFLTVGANGVKLAGVQDAINAKVNALDVTTDAAVGGQYVAAIQEADGIVSVKTRANVSDAVLTGYAKGSAPASGSEAVAATDDVKGAIAKLEHQVDAAKAAASAAHSVVAEGSGNTHVTVTTSQPDANGAITYTIGETNIASASDLTTEVTRAKNAETAIDSAVGLTKAADGEGRTYSNAGEYIGKQATNTVASDIKALDTQLKTVSDNLAAIQYKVVGTELTFYGMTQHA